MEEGHSWGKYRLRSDRLGRLILGTTLILFLIFSPYAAQAQAGNRASPSGNETLVQGRMGESYAKSFGVLDTPATQIMPLSDGRFLPASLSSPSRLYDRLPRFTLPSKLVSSPSAPRSSRSELDNLMDRTLTQARYYLGTPYRRGGSLQTGHTTDCSGFVQFIYKKAKIDLPHSSREQARLGMIVTHTLDFARMRPGDLLFFGHRGRHIGHVGIYLGAGKMIHASSRRRGVIITDLRQSSFQGAFVVAKRLFEVHYPQ